MSTKKRSRIPPAPRGLSAEGRRWWRAILDAYDLPEESLLLLQITLEALGRMREAEAVLKRDGPVFTDKRGVPRQHPACLVVRDAQQAVCRGLKQLGLDLEPLNAGPGRPPKGRT